jgi:hypothetical protein
MNKPKGVLFVCNLDLTIEEVLYNGLGVAPALQEDAQFLELVITADRGKAESFVREVVSGSAQFDWELNLSLDQTIRTFQKMA